MLGETLFPPHSSALRKEVQPCGKKETCSVPQPVPHPGRFGRRPRAPQHGTCLSRLDIVSAGKGWLYALWLASSQDKDFHILLSLEGGKSVEKEERSVCTPGGVNICDMYACPHPVSAASFLIKNCSNQPRGFLCEVEEPKLFVNTAQIQWILLFFFLHPPLKCFISAFCNKVLSFCNKSNFLRRVWNGNFVVL